MSDIEQRLLGTPQDNFGFLDEAEREELETYQAYGEEMLRCMPDNTNLRENVANIGIAVEHVYKLEALWVPLRDGGIKKNCREGTIFPAFGTVQDPYGMANVCKHICEDMDTMLRLEQEDSIPKKEWVEMYEGASGILKEALKRTPKH